MKKVIIEFGHSFSNPGKNWDGIGLDAVRDIDGKNPSNGIFLGICKDPRGHQYLLTGVADNGYLQNIDEQITHIDVRRVQVIDPDTIYIDSDPEYTIDGEDIEFLESELNESSPFDQFISLEKFKSIERLRSKFKKRETLVDKINKNTIDFVELPGQYEYLDNAVRLNANGKIEALAIDHQTFNENEEILKLINGKDIIEVAKELARARKVVPTLYDDITDVLDGKNNFSDKLESERVISDEEALEVINGRSILDVGRELYKFRKIMDPLAEQVDVILEPKHQPKKTLR